MKNSKKLFLLFAGFAAAALIVPAPVQAVTASDWQAGRIIDDAVFRDYGSMSVQQIQDFLNSKVPTCDTQGTQPSEYGGGTRAQYGTSKGVPPPYVCLKDYYENVDTKANNLSGKPVPAGAKSAAQIIYDTAQQYKINPKALIVLLQKEQTLITDDWPWPVQYQKATGYGCPDTAPCDTQYYGFSTQLKWAATMFNAILNNDPNWYTPYLVGNNYIQWHLTASCGGTNVNVQNNGTAALYNYTPYQPNQAALNNLYGLGDACSSYGNRNFWRLFNDWFGSPYFTINITYPVGDDSVDSLGDIAVIPIKLSNPPLSTVQLNYGVSDTSVAKIVGNNALVFTPSNWYIPQYITLQGLPSSVSSKDFNLEVLYINSPDGSYSQSITPFLQTLPVFWSNTTEAPVYRLYSSSAGKHAYAVSNDVVNSLKSSGYVVESTLGYQCGGSTNTPLIVDNSKGLVRNIDSPDIINKASAAPTILFSNAGGSVFVSILKNSSGTDSVLSTSNSEISKLQQNGYSVVTSFLLCNSGDTPIYRLNDRSQNSHFYTSSTAEVSNLLNYGLTYEGVAFYVNKSDTVPVYRLYNPASATHFYTISLDESIAAQKMGFKYEGIAFYLD